MQSESKLIEANEHITKAKKALKRNILQLRFTIDYEIASLEYKQAGDCFFAARAGDDAADAYEKAADLKAKQHDYFGAARCYEASAGALTKFSQKQAHAERKMCLYEKAVEQYKIAGKAETGGRVLLKLAASQCEEGNYMLSISTYERCIELFESEGKNHSVSDAYKELIPLLVREKIYDKAMICCEKHAEILFYLGFISSVNKAILCKLVIYLTNANLDYSETYNKANDILNDSERRSSSDFINSKEYDAGTDLITALQSRDSQQIDKILNLQLWKFLPTEICSLVKALLTRALESKLNCNDDIGTFIC